MINFYNYIISILICFIIISIIILILISFIDNKIEIFAIDKINVNTSDSNDLISSLKNNLIVYLKFNNKDIINGQITQNGIHNTNAIIVDSSSLFDYTSSISTLTNGCSINSTDYVKGDASIQFTGSSGIIQHLNSSYINNNFTVAFFIKNPDYNTSGIKTIISQALQNPTLGWLIRINDTNLEVVVGTNRNDEWLTIISKPAFISSASNNWCHVTLTYNNSSNPKWELYLDATRYITTSSDKPNTPLMLLTTNVGTIINCGSDCYEVVETGFNNDMHLLTIGCKLSSIVRKKGNLTNLINIESFFKITLTGGIKDINYTDGYLNTRTKYYIKFLSGNFKLSVPIDCTIDILLVGGGGGGGLNGGWEGGGGGGGGCVGIGKIKLKASIIYTINVGNGGKGGIFNTNNACNDGENGGNTSLSGDGVNEIAYGGGGGGWRSGINGGSGGGGSGHGGDYYGGNNTKGISKSNILSFIDNKRLTYYGNNGGFGHNASGGGGGGGANTVGVSTGGRWTVNGMNGGEGIGINIISENPDYYGGGGGGGAFRNHNNIDNIGGNGGIGGGGAGGNTNGHGVNGQVNTGGGGGGACGWVWGGNKVNGGNGGSGIVIIKFDIADFNKAKENIYKLEDSSSYRLDSFLPSQTLIDDLRVYNRKLNETQIKTIYYGTIIATTIDSQFTNNKLTSNSDDCVRNVFGINANLIAVPSTSGLLDSISDITTTTAHLTIAPQFMQTFKILGDINNNPIQLLFSQPVFNKDNPNLYSPVKLFNKDANKTNANNFCAFLSTYAIISDNKSYNYDNNTGIYALTHFKVPDCGNIRFNDNTRPSGDYIYIKFPEAFVLHRYSFTAIAGFANRAPGNWTLYIYNKSLSPFYMSYKYPSEGKLTVKDYCEINQRIFYVDLIYPNITSQVSSNEYLFVFHSIVGNNPNDNFGILAFQEMVLYKKNPLL